ncbi:hypothetical protein BCR33DRAFT_744912 [Rhizoclosmatium globosum]|uniref:Uncharacterized protein n=1 Tax=Rhizoclosmatium globosum TaxID=329046 RepID=A0A1Y2B6M8_9FUNG|nr:hypothetical protein BCR33DRAFT_744912 [Rhizoclosmatium globosum]|eukprot:ORY30491.1 hypothetical protein BCR33DRAFT_744912 [Rhizoclosmatium globosum]
MSRIPTPPLGARSTTTTSSAPSISRTPTNGGAAKKTPPSTTHHRTTSTTTTTTTTSSSNHLSPNQTTNPQMKRTTSTAATTPKKTPSPVRPLNSTTSLTNSTGSSPSIARSRSHAAIPLPLQKKKEAPVPEKDLLIAALKDQIVQLEARLNPQQQQPSEDPDAPAVPVPPVPVRAPPLPFPSLLRLLANLPPIEKHAQSPAIKIAQLESQVSLHEMTIDRLEDKVAAFASKDTAVAYLIQEKEASEARLDMIIKDKDATIETMRRQIEMQVSGLFSEVSKSRELLVTQSEAHAEDLKRLNEIIAQQAAELGQLREKLKEKGHEE